MNMDAIHELDMVVLRHDLLEHGLRQGDIGAVVHVYRDAAALEVEFVTGEGETLAVVTLVPDDVRAMRSREILHVWDLAA